jgi:hypothetical protein
MAIQLTTTKDAAQHGIKVLVHGPAGAGKTVLCSTTGEPTVIISAEAGLLSLRHVDIPVVSVSCMADVQEAYTMIAGDQGKEYSWICLDSISEIAEQVLAFEMKQTKDPRKAYGELSAQMMDLLRAFRDLPGKNVYMSCKQARTEDDDGRTSYGPLMPGQKLAQQIPYLFDEVFSLRVEKDAEGNPTRWLQTSADIKYTAKDRSGALDLYEPANLAAIAAKIRGDATTKAA